MFPQYHDMLKKQSEWLMLDDEYSRQDKAPRRAYNLRMSPPVRTIPSEYNVGEAFSNGGMLSPVRPVPTPVINDKRPPLYNEMMEEKMAAHKLRVEIPPAATMDDIEEMKEIMAETRSSLPNDLSLLKQYLGWLDISPLVEGMPDGEKMAMFIRSIKSQRKLMNSSAGVYCGRLLFIMGRYHHDRSLSGLGFFKTYQKYLELAAARDMVDHARDVSLEEINKVIVQLNKKDPVIAAYVWISAVSCGRFDDITHINKIALVDDKLYVDWGPNKNHRRQGEIMSMVYGDQDEIGELYLSTSMKREIARWSQSGSITKISASQANAAMKNLCKVEGKKNITTYSFRRYAIQRIVSQHTGANGTVNWDAVIDRTGHANRLMPRNIYRKTANAELRRVLTMEEEKLMRAFDAKVGNRDESVESDGSE